MDQPAHHRARRPPVDERHGDRPPLVWTYLPTPLVLDFVKAVEPELVIYYCLADFAASSSGARNIRRTEHSPFRDADLVFVQSESLAEGILWEYAATALYRWRGWL